jgi:hypothetical protein
MLNLAKKRNYNMNEAKKFFLPAWAINPETGRIYDEISTWFSSYIVTTQGQLVIITGHIKSADPIMSLHHFSSLEYSILGDGIRALCDKIYANEDHFVCFAKDKQSSGKLREISESLRETLEKMRGAIAWAKQKKEREAAASWGVDEPWLTGLERKASGLSPRSERLIY